MRYACLAVNAQFVIEICKCRTETRVFLKENGLPDDAKFVRAGHDQFGTLNLVVESAEFEEVEENALIPMLPRPLFTKV